MARPPDTNTALTAATRRDLEAFNKRARVHRRAASAWDWEIYSSIVKGFWETNFKKIGLLWICRAHGIKATKNTSKEELKEMLYHRRVRPIGYDLMSAGYEALLDQRRSELCDEDTTEQPPNDQGDVDDPTPAWIDSSDSDDSSEEQESDDEAPAGDMTHEDIRCTECEHPFGNGELRCACHTCGAPVHDPEHHLECSEYGRPMADRHGAPGIFCNSCGVGDLFVPSQRRRVRFEDEHDDADELSDRGE